MKCFSAFLANTSRMSIDRQVRSGHRQRVYVTVLWRAWPISCSRSSVAVAAPARLGPICRMLCTGA